MNWSMFIFVLVLAATNYSCDSIYLRIDVIRLNSPISCLIEWHIVCWMIASKLQILRDVDGCLRNQEPLNFGHIKMENGNNS